MKMIKKYVRVAAMILVFAMVASVLCSCGSTPVAKFTAENGKTYTATKSELDFMMVYTKQNLFTGNLWFSAYDTSSLWTSTYANDLTYDEYFTASVFSQIKSILVEKYLFEKFGLSLDKDTVASIKKEVDTAKLNAGGAGAYKQYYGYTASQLLDYRLTAEKYNAILDYLYGENGTDKVTDEEKETYFNDNYVSYQFIYLDMNKKVKVDEDGNKVRKTTTDSNGNVTVTDEYETEDLTEEEAEEKDLLAAKIIQRLDAGEAFEDLAAEFSDDYTSVKYPKGIFTLSSGTLFNDTAANEAVAALDVGQYTQPLSMGDGEMTYIVKRVTPVEKAYATDEYADMFSTYDDTVKYDKYDKFINTFFDSVTIDESIIPDYSMANTFLSDYVDYYYQMYYQYYQSSN